MILAFSLIVFCCHLLAQAEPENQNRQIRQPVVAIVSRGTDVADTFKAFCDILLVEFSRQDFAKVVERAEIDRIKSELALTAKPDNTAESPAFGRLLGADVLIELEQHGPNNVSVKMLDVGSGRLTFERLFTLHREPLISAVEIREAVANAMGFVVLPEGSWTVGIGAIINVSGNARLDGISGSLRKALVATLQEEPWAVVLERESPERLLEELALVREGFAKHGISELPSADLIVSADYREASPDAGALDILIRLAVTGPKNTVMKELRIGSVPIDKMEGVAVSLHSALCELRTSLPLLGQKQTVNDEFVRLRNAGILMTPDSSRFRSEREKLDLRQARRLLQCALLLNEKDRLCRLFLVKCDFITLLWDYSTKDGWISHAGESAGTRMDYVRRMSVLCDELDAIHRNQPDLPGSRRLYESLAFELYLRYEVNSAIREMSINLYECISRRWGTDPEIQKKLMELRADSPIKMVWTAMEQVDINPKGYLAAVYEFTRKNYSKNPDAIISFADETATHGNVLVRFCALSAKAKMLYLVRNDPDCIRVYKEAVKLFPDAVKQLDAGTVFDNGQSFTFFLIKACLKFKEPVLPILEPVLSPFIQKGTMPYGDVIAALGPLMEACEVQHEFDKGMRMAHWMAVGDDFIYREPDFANYWYDLFRSKCDGKSVPDPDTMQPILRFKEYASYVVMEEMPDSIWIVLMKPQGPCGVAFIFNTGTETLLPLASVNSSRVSAMAKSKTAVALGTLGDGVYFLDYAGRLLRHIPAGDPSLPASDVKSICSDGTNFFAIMMDNTTTYLTQWDSVEGQCKVLAPDSRQERQTGLYARYWVPNDQLCIETSDLLHCGNALFLKTNGTWKLEYSHPRPQAVEKYPRRFDWIDGTRRFWLCFKPFALGEPRTAELFDEDGRRVTQISALRFGGSVTVIGDGNRIWFTNRHGLYEVSLDSGLIRPLMQGYDHGFNTIFMSNKRIYVLARSALYRFPAP